MFILYDAGDAAYELPEELTPAWVAPELDFSMERSPGSEECFAIGDGRPLPGPYELAGRIARATPGALATLLDAVKAALLTAVALAFEEDGTEVWRLPVDTGARVRGTLAEQPLGAASNISVVRVTIALSRLDGPTPGLADQADTSPAITIS
jgi:hypothetical protein